MIKMRKVFQMIKAHNYFDSIFYTVNTIVESIFIDRSEDSDRKSWGVEVMGGGMGNALLFFPAVDL